MLAERNKTVFTAMHAPPLRRVLSTSRCAVWDRIHGSCDMCAGHTQISGSLIKRPRCRENLNQITNKFRFKSNLNYS
jgi:uncharacterized Fe-S cluster-containing MiaB family protein